MQNAVKAFKLTIPANGTVNNIFFVDCELGDSITSKIILGFPPGCAGTVGVRIEHGGQQLYPLTPGTFFIFDNYTLEVPVIDQGTSGQWHVAGYNTDQYSHTINVYFFFEYVDLAQGTGVTSLIAV